MKSYSLAIDSVNLTCSKCNQIFLSEQKCCGIVSPKMVYRIGDKLFTKEELKQYQEKEIKKVS